MNLYVACARLHSTLRRPQVLTAIREIVCDLIGATEMAIFEQDHKGSRLLLVACFGIESADYHEIAVGSGHIGGVAETGESYIRTRANEPKVLLENHLTACIPMKLEGKLFGAIAIFRLLGQKTSLEPLDYQLLDFLSTHAAIALHCADLHETFCTSATEAPE